MSCMLKVLEEDFVSKTLGLSCSNTVIKGKKKKKRGKGGKQNMVKREHLGCHRINDDNSSLQSLQA